MQIKDLGGQGTLRKYPFPALFLKRYDSKRVRGWGSAKRLRGKDLKEVKKAKEIKEVKEDKRGARRGSSRTGKAG